MKLRKIIPIILSVAAISLTGCGGKASNESKSPDKESSSSQPASSKDTGRGQGSESETSSNAGSDEEARTGTSSGEISGTGDETSTPADKGTAGRHETSSDGKAGTSSGTTRAKKPNPGDVKGTGVAYEGTCRYFLADDFKLTYDWLASNGGNDWEYGIGHNGESGMSIPEYLDVTDRHGFDIGKDSKYGRYAILEPTDGNPLKDRGLDEIYVYDGTSSGLMSPRDAMQAGYLFYRAFYDNGVMKAINAPEDLAGSEEMAWVYDSWGEPTRVERVNVGYAWIYEYADCSVAVSYNTLWSHIIYVDVMQKGLEDAWVEANS